MPAKINYWQIKLEDGTPAFMALITPEGWKRPKPKPLPWYKRALGTDRIQYHKPYPRICWFASDPLPSILVGEWYVPLSQPMELLKHLWGIIARNGP